jgi:hypothetical protein
MLIEEKLNKTHSTGNYVMTNSIRVKWFVAYLKITYILNRESLNLYRRVKFLKKELIL